MNGIQRKSLEKRAEAHRFIQGQTYRGVGLRGELRELLSPGFRHLWGWSGGGRGWIWVWNDSRGHQGRFPIPNGTRRLTFLPSSLLSQSTIPPSLHSFIYSSMQSITHLSVSSGRRKGKQTEGQKDRSEWMGHR